MVSKVFPLWLEDEEIKILKDSSKKENRSVNNFVKSKLFTNDKNKKVKIIL